MNCILLPSSIHDEPKITNLEQVKHIKSVLKLNVGDSLLIGEINGNIGRAVVSAIKESEILLTNIVLDIHPPPKLDLTVILALPRPKVLRRLIMDMTALGVNKIILLNSYRTQKSYWQSPLLTRIDEFIFEGLQQAVDTIVPVVELKKRFKPFVEDEFPQILSQSHGKGVIAHPYASQSWQAYLLDIKSSNKSIITMPKVLFIGAEGGWINYEVDMLCQYGCEPVSLGQRILRTESAVNVMLGGWLV